MDIINIDKSPIISHNITDLSIIDPIVSIHINLSVRRSTFHPVPPSKQISMSLQKGRPNSILQVVHIRDIKKVDQCHSLYMSAALLRESNYDHTNLAGHERLRAELLIKESQNSFKSRLKILDDLFLGLLIHELPVRSC